ncbi:hypothetical protein HDV57DRAFT_329624 [Trichoderma longibrachiatum]|uniref:Uncharacterized protein n=1 Tax=Trichoderma longibrachiatum ATCC 18648 TaxID=983965 RepID=A0A2T4BVQ6_TRILO|nr:hypothetical protein M440DRAFT_129976 [Trichoderma longibrachiatum ATCC 18648]
MRRRRDRRDDEPRDCAFTTPSPASLSVNLIQHHSIPSSRRPPRPTLFDNPWHRLIFRVAGSYSFPSARSQLFFLPSAYCNCYRRWFPTIPSHPSPRIRGRGRTCSRLLSRSTTQQGGRTLVCFDQICLLFLFDSRFRPVTLCVPIWSSREHPLPLPLVVCLQHRLTRSFGRRLCASRRQPALRFGHARRAWLVAPYLAPRQERRNSNLPYPLPGVLLPGVGKGRHREGRPGCCCI